jgi:FKBP12-rapamycin complex-associated protein
VHPAYDQLVNKLLNRERLPPDLGPVERYVAWMCSSTQLMSRFAADPMSEMSVAAEQAKLPVNQVQLKAAWDCSNVTSKQEWLEWMKRLGNELMRESPSQAIRASRNLAEVHPPFARELFNVAFVSCWAELYDQYQVGTGRPDRECALTPGRRT